MGGLEVSDRVDDTKAASTQLRLLDAALEVFGRLGYGDSRVQDICEAAGSARATFYRHFTGKEEVLLALAARFRAEVDTVVDRLQPVTPDAAGYAALHDFVDGLLAASRRWAPVVEVLSLPDRPVEHVRRDAADHMAIIARSLGSALRGGGGGGADPNTHALAVVAIVDGVAGQTRATGNARHRAAIATAVTTLAFRMVQPDADPAVAGG